MTNRHMKRCSSLLIISEIQIKTTMRYHFNQSEWAPSKKATNNKCWRRCGEKWALIHCWQDISWPSHYGKQYDITQKTKNRVAIWSSNLNARDITRESCNLKRYMHHPYVQSSSIYNSQAREQLRCPSARNGWRRCDTYIVALIQSVCRVWLFQPREMQHSRLSRPSLSPWVCSNSCPLNPWYHSTISSFVASFSSCLQSFPASGFSPRVSFSHQVASVL